MSLLCAQCKTPDDGQRNCPKYVRFYYKNKFEKLEHLVGFIIRIRTKYILKAGSKQELKQLTYLKFNPCRE